MRAALVCNLSKALKCVLLQFPQTRMQYVMDGKITFPFCIEIHQVTWLLTIMLIYFCVTFSLCCGYVLLLLSIFQLGNFVFDRDSLSTVTLIFKMCV